MFRIPKYFAIFQENKATPSIPGQVGTRKRYVIG